ncbi:MAG: hypothetical protein ACTHLN_06465 [Tepidisphaeraceae bacterium]
MLVALAKPLLADVYQWSAPLPDVISNETKDHPRAFLWVPDQCEHVRAVVVAVQNMQEEQLFKDASFRKTLSDLNFALVWIAPPMATMEFRFDQGEDHVLTRALDELAAASGYREIAQAPLVPVGHSASASWGWGVAAWNPGRTLAVLSLSGQWPYFTEKNWGHRSVDGVPGMTTKGEFEIGGNLDKGWYAGLKGSFFKDHPHAAFSHVVEPGGDHFSASKEKIDLINLFLRKASEYRLPAQSKTDGPVTLKTIDPATMGWLYDGWRRDQPPEAPAAPVADYTGKRDHAYWAFDGEMAHAIEKFQGSQRNKTNVLLAYRQKDGFVQPRPDHMEVHLKFEPIDDGLTFKLSGGFWDQVPATKDGKPAGWQNTLAEGTRTVQQGDPIPHPKGEDDRLHIVPICGPVEQLSSDTFAIRFNRAGMDNPKRSNSICFNLVYPGDDTFKRSEERAELRFPLKNTNGQPQTITFPAIDNVSANALPASIDLKAVSSAGAKVYYYVREGPAEVNDAGVLTFTPIPPKASYPLRVTVVAWQWGRSLPPLLQSAAPITRTFQITKP